MAVAEHPEKLRSCISQPPSPPSSTGSACRNSVDLHEGDPDSLSALHQAAREPKIAVSVPESRGTLDRDRNFRALPDVSSENAC